MPILNFDELESEQTEPVSEQNPVLNLDEVDRLEQQGAVPQPLGPLDLDAAPTLVPPGGDDPGLAGAAWKMVRDFLTLPRELVGGLEEAVVRGPMQAAEGYGGVLGTARNKLKEFRAEKAEPYSLKAVGQTLAGPIADALAPTEALLKGIGSVEDWLTDNGGWIERDPNAGLIEDTYRGLGQAAGFMAGGWAAKLHGLPLTLAPTAMGALQEAGAMGEDAQAEGATPEQQAIATIAGTVLGTTEGVTGAYFLNKINKATGGKLWQVLEKVGGVNAPPSVLRETVFAFVTEFSQEGFQTVGENLIASDIAEYDPERAAGKNFWRSAISGGLVGALIGAPTASYHKMRVAQEQEEQNWRRDFLLSQFPEINSIGGKFTPLSLANNARVINLLESLIEQQDINDLIQVKEGLAFDVLMRKALPNIAKELKVKPSRAELDYAGADVSEFEGVPFDPTFHPDNAQANDTRSSIELLTQTDEKVVYQQGGYLKAEIADMALKLSAAESRLLKAQKALEEARAVGKDAVLVKNLEKVVKTNKASVAYNKKELSRYKRSRDSFLKTLPRMVEVLQQMASVMGYPNAKFLISGETAKPTSIASAGRALNTTDAQGNPVDVLVFGFNPKSNPFQQLFPVAADRKPLTGAARKLAWTAIYETVVHEGGHQFATMKLTELYESYRKVHKALKKNKTLPEILVDYGKETVEQATAYSSILFDYRQFINNIYNEQLTAAEFQGVARGLAWASTEGRGELEAGDLRGIVDRNYFLSFDEYVAHRFERLAGSVQNGELSQELNRVMNKHFFQRYLKAYEDAADLILREKSKYSTSPGGYVTRRGALSPSAHNRQALDLQIRRLVVGREIEDIRERLAKGGGKGLIDAIKGAVPGLDPEGYAGLQQELDRFTWAQKWFMNLSQIARDNPHIQALQSYMNTVANVWAPYSRHTFDRAVQTLGKWEGLGKEGANRVTNVLMEEAEDEAELPSTLLVKRLNEAEQEVYFSIRRDLNFMLDEMRRVAIKQATEMLSGEELNTQVKEINDDFEGMKGKGYFPYMRFGKYTLSVRASKDMVLDGRRYKQGQQISWESFDYTRERSVARRAWAAKNPDLIISEQMRTDTTYAVQGLPKVFLRSLKEALQASGAPAAAMKELNQVITDNLPTKSFKRQFLRKRGIKGFSQDFMRSYAAYMRMGASHISRVEHAPAMVQAIQQMKDELDIISRTKGANGDARSMMLDWMQKHFDYIMNPGNELQALRAAGFFWFLGFNVKSAVLNLFQIPVVGLPYMQGRFGDVSAVKNLTKAQMDVVRYWKDREAWVAEARSEEERRFSYAMRQGAIEPGGAHFSLKGASTYWNPDDPNARFYDLTKLNIINTNEPGASLRLLVAMLEREKKELVPNAQKIQDLENAITEQQAFGGPLDYITFEVYNLSDVLQELGYDGAVILENDDIDQGSTVFIRHRLDRIKEITRKQMVQRSNVEPGRNGEIVRMLQHLQHMGVTDQSLAMELAIAASENKADRLAPINAGERIWYNVSAWGALPFHVTEKVNRQVMAIAAYNAARDEGLSVQESTLEAILAVRLSMYEYSNWNRPLFMWGKKSVFFLFMNYVQNTADFALQGNKAALRFWIMMGMLAGITGLPFAQDLEDLLDFMITRLNTWLGIKNPKFQLRQELRELLTQMTDNPDLFLHGFAQDSFGLSYLSQLTGIPFPSMDMASSIGMGDVIPGTNVPELLAERGMKEGTVAAISEFGGAGATAANQAFSAMLSTSPDKWRSLEKIMPTFAKNVSQAARYAVRGKEQTAGGEIVAEFDPHDVRAMMEIGGKALGFTPTRVSRGWESIMAERELVEYYRRRQAQVLAQHNFAINKKDREGIADAWKEIETYNRIVPYPEMQIDKDTLERSAKQYVTKQAKAEAGVTQGEKFRRLQEEVRETYGNQLDADTLDNE